MNQFVEPKLKGKPKINRLVRTIHIYTSMLMLLIMLFFTLTGITLNHRDWFSSVEPAQQSELTLPEKFQDISVWEHEALAQGDKLRRWLQTEHSVNGNQVGYEWEPEELLMVIDVKEPGGYSIAEVDLESGLILLERQSYGAIATLNDLHMGRYSGELWRWFIDLSALMMLLFTLTGMWLVIPQKKRRSTLFAVAAAGSSIMGGAYLGVILL